MSRSKHFQEYFDSIQTREDRNLSIINAYLDCYSGVIIIIILMIMSYS